MKEKSDDDDDDGDTIGLREVEDAWWASKRLSYIQTQFWIVQYLVVYVNLCQVITVAVYIFVIACLIGRRETDDGFRGDFNFPFFTLANIVIYVGWMKVRLAAI